MNSVLANISRISPQLNTKASSLTECVLKKASRNTFENSVELNASRAISRQWKANTQNRLHRHSPAGFNKKIELNYVTQPPQKSKKLSKLTMAGADSDKDGKQSIAKKFDRGRHEGTGKLRKKGLLNADLSKNPFVKSRHMTKGFVGKRIAGTLDNSSNTLLTIGQQGNKSNLRNAAPTVFRTFLARDFRRNVSKHSLKRNSLLNGAQKKVKKAARKYDGPIEALNKPKKCETQVKKTWKQWVVDPHKFLTKTPAATTTESEPKKETSELAKELLQIRDIYANEKPSNVHDLKHIKDLLGADKKSKRSSSLAHDVKPNLVFLPSLVTKIPYDTKLATGSNSLKSERSENERRLRDELTDLSNLIENITKLGMV